MIGKLISTKKQFDETQIIETQADIQVSKPLFAAKRGPKHTRSFAAENKTDDELFATAKQRRVEKSKIAKASPLL